MSLITSVVLLIVFSILAYWKPNAVLFLIMAGMALMIGLYWYDMYSTNTGMSISLVLISYSFLCFGFAYKITLWDDRE